MEVAEKHKLMVPDLRFGEFAEEWTETRIQKVFSIFNGYAFSSGDAAKEGCRWVKIADVGINEMKSDEPSCLPMDYQEKHKKFVLHKDDYVVALTRPILNGQLKIARLDSLFEGALLNQRVGRIDSSNHLDFVYNFLQRYEIVSRIEGRIAGTDPPNLSPNEIASLRAFIPTLPEQKKIADFLSAVDARIKHLNRKKELLERYKKGVMQKLFSYEVRFGSGSLRTGTLGSFGSFYYGKSAPKHSLSEDATTPCVRYGELYTKFHGLVDQIHSYTTIPSEKLKFSKGGEILVPRVGEDPLDFSKCSYLPMKDIAIGEMISVYNTKENGVFMTQYIRARLKKQFARLVEGGNVSNLYYRYLEDVEIEIPSKEEQQKIADFLSTLDRKIEAVSTQIAKTQQFKKGLLQKMFV